MTAEEVQKKTEEEEQRYISYFPQDFELYYNLLDRFLKMDDTSYTEAYMLKNESEALMARFNTIYSLAAKIAAAKGDKTDVQKYYYGIYKSLERIHEESRMVWNKGEKKVGRTA